VTQSKVAEVNLMVIIKTLRDRQLWGKQLIQLWQWITPTMLRITTGP